LSVIPEARPAAAVGVAAFDVLGFRRDRFGEDIGEKCGTSGGN
jgi:hypothetical protein